MWKEVRKNYRRLVAFILTVTMVLANIGGSLGTVFAAGETEEALFLVDSAGIQEAIRDAKEAGEVFRFSSLELKARAVSVKNKYEKLLGTREGKVYQLEADVDRRYAPEYTSLEVFYNAGTDNVVFLCINESDLVVTFRVRVGGYETEPVVVKPNGANVEEEENLSSYTENYEAEDMVDDVKKNVKAEVVDTKETSEKESFVAGERAEEEETDGAVSESASEEDTQPEETSEALEAGQEPETKENEEKSPEEAAGTPEEAPEETEPEEVAEETEPEEVAEETEAEVLEPEEAEPEEDGREEQIGLSRHEAAIVAVSVNDLETKNGETGEEVPLGEAETEDEPEAVESEPAESKGNGMETEEDAAKETTAEETDAGGMNAKEDGDGKEPEEDTGEEESEGVKPGETESREEAGESSTATQEPAPEDAEESAAKETEGSVSGETGKDSANVAGNVPDIEEEDGQLLDDSIGTQEVLKAKEYETVTIRDHANARALQVALEDIRMAGDSAVNGEIGEILDAIRALIDHYKNGAYATEEELEEAIEAIEAMVEGLGDYPYPEEVMEAMNELQEILGLGVQTLEAEGECTCEDMCTWFWGKYININQDCPVCSHATEEELDPYTYDPDHPEMFVCKGKQAVIPGKNPDCKHNAAANGGSLWESWFPGAGSPDLIPASCQYPATADEAIECMGCGARWLWSFDSESKPDPDAHDFGKNDPVIIKEATCMEDGLQVQTCVFCGDIETVIKGGHKRPDDETKIEVIPATCKDGEIRYICENCGEAATENLPGKHGKFTGGVCEECGATAYRVFTYEDGATPSGSGYELKLCARIIVEKDGNIYEEDRDGNRWNDGSFAVVINEALMGKIKNMKDENNNIVMTHVTGYSNGKTYQVGDRVPYGEILDMEVATEASGDDDKVIYLEAVREVLDDFTPNKVMYEAAHSNPRPELRTEAYETSGGITKEVQYQNDGRTCVITYIIPEKYERDTIDINATGDVMEAYETIQKKRFGNNGTQPGDVLGPVYIKVINNSQKKFSYVEGSFILQSPGYNGEGAYLPDIRTFDGSIPPKASIPSRVSNQALKYLYGVENDLMHRDLQDDILDEKLKEKGYEKGLEDLHQYYLDYYNSFYSKKYNTVWSNLSQLPYELLVERNVGIFGGHSSASGPKETNPEVAGAGYSYMYTRLMSVVPGNEEGLKDYNGIYAVGNYMKGTVSYDENAKAVLGELKPGADSRLNGMSLFFEGEGNDFYQNTVWGIEVGFQLKETPEGPENPEDPPETPPTTPPTTPSGGGGNGGGGGGGGRTPRTTTTIDMPEVPLADLPAEPVTELIEELEVPLIALPKTGDSRHSGMLLMMFGMAGIGMILSAAGLKKRNGESD